MNSHALEVLEFTAVLEAVASRCGSELARASVLALRPGAEVEGVRRELETVTEARDLHLAHPGWAPPLPPDARRALKVLAVEGGVLEPPDLLVLLRLLEAASTLAEALPERLGAAEAPHLRSLREFLHRDDALLQRLGEVVDEDGSIRDGASPTLRQLRKRIRGARTRIVRRLEAWMATLPDRVRVPDASVSVREGRYVIQIRREGRSEVGGVLHGESATGATLFVEPPLALELMAEILELEREETLEVRRILRETTGRIRPAHPPLVGTLEALVRFDSLWARGLTATRWDAHLPRILTPDEEGREAVRVVQGRHPLLLEAHQAGEVGEGRPARTGGEGGKGGEGPGLRGVGEGRDGVVPFDLVLEPGERALVVSGPNTGGKTVFLKAMGLLPLLAQSGILPPVGPGTVLPFLRDLFADIGDEQSIAASLSTFSAHLANAREVLEGAGPGTLVLMDEMGTGTDPAEGAALARAILETLVERGARALVTSHLGAMKRLDAEGSGIVNASLLFDAERIAPTYRFRKGRPGRSYGLAMARRLGIPGAVLDRAEGYVDSGELEVETLLATLEAREEALARAHAEAERARSEARRLLDEARTRTRALDDRERRAEVTAREEARKVLLEAREEVEAAIRELREADREAREAREREARRRVEEAARTQEAKARRAREKGRPRRGGKVRGDQAAAHTDLPAPEPGSRVRILGSGARGIVREVEGERVTVEVGALRFEVGAGDVERIAHAETPRERAARGGGGRGPVVEVEVRPEVHLLGLRVEEVDLALGRALDDAVLGQLHELRIVHGKGTGAVRARVQELLRRDARVESFRGGVHGEGGGGVTVAVLR